MAQSIETDLIIQRYRERAEQYRQLAEASAKREAFLILLSQKAAWCGRGSEA